MPPRIFLKPDREIPLLRGHPWIFSGAVAGLEGEVLPGEVGEVYSSRGQYLGTGHINPRSQILCRLLTTQREVVDTSFLRRRILQAFRLRREWFPEEIHARRMVNGEGDFLPGLIVDRYGDLLVMQCLTAGMERWKEDIVNVLAEELRPESIYERNDAAVRREEGLPSSKGFLRGKTLPDSIEVREGEARFQVRFQEGQKTGFYLDQRENRDRVRAISRGKSVLDICCYTGAFSVYAGLGGATELTLIDSSRDALKQAEEHLRLNSLDAVPHHLIRGDAFEAVRDLSPVYDVIVLDPPPFVRKKEALPRASRGYKDLNLQAFRRLKPEGTLFTFSCSHSMDWDLFQKIVFSAALDSGRQVQIIGRMSHPADHPFHLSHPEGEYLKGFICRVMEQ
jgi:23S rRNA (cytosine1962-C5)-methyltransferase